MDKNLRILLDVLNSNLKALKENGYKIYDNDIVNDNFYLDKIEYNSERDELIFVCNYE